MARKNANTGNDNSAARHIWTGNDHDGPRIRLMRHAPKARALIKKYVRHTWKHSPDHSQYVFREYQLCTILERPVESPIQRYLQVSDIAWVLEISPLMLMNDPALPF